MNHGDNFDATAMTEVNQALAAKCEHLMQELRAEVAKTARLLRELDELRALNAALVAMLQSTAVQSDFDTCNGCGRKFGWSRQNHHCASCGTCLKDHHSACGEGSCRLANLLKRAGQEMKLSGGEVQASEPGGGPGATPGAPTKRTRAEKTEGPK